MNGYEVKIVESSREFSAREKIKMKDLSNAYRLDQCIGDKGESFIISPVDYAILNVQNEHSKQDKEYVKYIIIDKDGNKYHTGSESFWTSFMNIWSEMKEAGEDDYQIEVYTRESRNYAGKTFMTCSLV